MRVSIALETAAAIGLFGVIVYLIGAALLPWGRGETLASSSGLAQESTELRENQLVLALSTDCGVCEMSVPFHGALATAASEVGVRVSAIFVEGEVAGREYLQSRDIGADVVSSAEFSKHVRGTPTILLAKPNGELLKVWTGLLTPERMKEVAVTVGISNEFQEIALHRDDLMGPSFYGVPMIGISELLEAPAGGLTLIDTRPRFVYDAGHLEKSVNIPLEELNARLPIEVPQENDIVFFCNLDAACESLSRAT